MLRLPLAHRHVGLAERPGQQRAVQQVAGPDPGPPLRHDVEREPRGVLVELPHQRLDAGRVEGRARQLVQRPDDADVRHVGRVPAAEDLRERADVAGSDVPGPAGKRHHERYVLRAHPLGQQTHLGIAERERGHHPVPHHGGGGGHRARAPAARRKPVPAGATPPGRTRSRRPSPGPAGPSAVAGRAPRPPRPPPSPPARARRRGGGPTSTRTAPPARRSSGCATTARGSPRDAASALARASAAPIQAAPATTPAAVAAFPRRAASAAPASPPIALANPICCARCPRCTRSCACPCADPTAPARSMATQGTYRFAGTKEVCRRVDRRSDDRRRPSEDRDLVRTWSAPGATSASAGLSGRWASSSTPMRSRSHGGASS